MKAVLDWFIRNPVAANLLMLVIIVGGLVSAPQLDNEFFPHVEPGMVSVTVPYPGAGPLEVEEQLCIKIEEAISDVKGVDEIRVTASQGLCQVRVEMVEDWEIQRLVNDVKNRVDAIDTFPADAERPVVADVSMDREVMRVVVSGGDDEASIKEKALHLKDQLTRLPGVTQVEEGGVRESVVAVEVPERTLRAYGLSFDDIARAIRRSSVNLPAGQLRNRAGDIQIQVYGQDYRAREFADIVVIKQRDGSRVTLGDIAILRDTFVEKNFVMEYEGRIAAELSVQVGEQPDTIGTARRVRDFLADYNRELPPGYEATVWSDSSAYLGDRLRILSSNSLQGLALVFVLLLLFLRPVLALWVTAGIAVAYLGTIMMMPLAGVTVNVVSTFSFLLILGIVVDDAIVVSENIYSYHERGLPGSLAASRGVNTIAKPVVLAVITTLLVFVPMFFAPGNSSQMFEPIPVIAILALSFSLIEALLILPSHLSHLKPEKPATNPVAARIARVRHLFTAGLNRFSFRVYQPLLARCLAHQGATLCFFLAALLVSLSLFVGGWLPSSFMPDFQNEQIVARAELQEGAGFARVEEVREQIESGLETLRRNDRARNRGGGSALRDSFTSVDGNVIVAEVNLSANHARDITTSELQQLWRKAIGEIHGVKDFQVSSSVMPVSRDITLQLAGRDLEQLRLAAEDLKEALARYGGVTGVGDTLSSARQEIRIDLRPEGRTLGLELEDIARQVRHAFYGAEAQRIPRLREDVRVMVRYPAGQRTAFENLEQMRIKVNEETFVPFEAVARATFVPGYTTITRVDRQRVVEVFADVDSAQANANEIAGSILTETWSELAQQYPDVELKPEGDQFEQQQVFVFLAIGLMFALFAIYTLLAVEFRSYLQPLYILSAVPFGIAGSVLGHLLLGMNFSMPSGFGVMATAGVVVNSNLVLIDRINVLREEGLATLEAVKQGARERLRPILLTMITTFFGLMPILLETSPAVAPLKPLVVSLSFGVVFATGITLLMVPALYLAMEELKARLGFASASRVEISEEVSTHSG